MQAVLAAAQEAGAEEVLTSALTRKGSGATQRVHIHHQYGMRPQKTILIMLLGDLIP